MKTLTEDCLGNLGIAIAGAAKFNSEACKDFFGKLDIDTVHGRDQKFMNSLKILSVNDPSILSRVFLMRQKLNNGIKLTQDEASELLESLKAKGFDFVNLDIEGYIFGNLDMTNASVGGVCDFNGVTIRNNLIAIDMTVGGDNNQSNMQVDGLDNQIGMQVLTGGIKVGSTS